MPKLGPWSEQFPVAFYSGGDTTRNAFNKHIQEIHRIYGLISDIDADKVSASDLNSTLGNFSSQLQSHINSTNPHPNWKPSLKFSDITGTLDGSRITGTLTNAYIDATHVNNLKSFINNNVTIPNKGDGITGSNLGNDGYIKFNNGLIVQWGKTADQHDYVDPNTGITHNFTTPFPSQCFTVIGQSCHGGIGQALGAMHSIEGITKTGFTFTHQKFHASYSGGPIAWFIRYIAIGI